MKNKFLLTSIVIPAYNEEKNIPGVIKECLQLKKRFPIEIIVIDDGSKDKTAQIAKKAGATKVIRYEKNKGKGGAFKVGIDHAKGEYIVQIDSDHQFQPDEIPLFIEKLHQGYDLVLGTRFNKGNVEKGSVSKLNLFGNWLMSFTTTFFSGIHVTDIMAGFKGFKTDVAKKLDLITPHFGYEAEIIVKAGKLDLSVAEVPITYKKRVFGTSGVSAIRDGSKVSYTIIKLYFTFPGPPLGQGVVGKRILRIFIPFWFICFLPLLTYIHTKNIMALETHVFYAIIVFFFLLLLTRSRLAAIMGSGFFSTVNLLASMHQPASRFIFSESLIHHLPMSTPLIQVFFLFNLLSIFIVLFFQRDKLKVFFSMITVFILLFFYLVKLLPTTHTFYAVAELYLVGLGIILSIYFKKFEINISQTFFLSSLVTFASFLLHIPFSGILGAALFFGTFISSLFLEIVSFRKLNSPLFSLRRVILMTLLGIFVIVSIIR